MEKTYEERMAICKACLLARETWDGMIRCDSSRYMSPDGTKTSYLPKSGYLKGCGCLTNIKNRDPNSHCVAGK